MQSYDLGCSYGGGSDPESVLTEAGLSFVSHSQSKWKKSMRDLICDTLKCSIINNKDRGASIQQILNMKANKSIAEITILKLYW